MQQKCKIFSPFYTCLRDELNRADAGLLEKALPLSNLSINDTATVDLGISPTENLSINETGAVDLGISPNENSFRKVCSDDGLRTASE
jgi:hypothetical protein